MANKYYVRQNASPNWNATAPTNWGTASGLANNTPAPTSADAIFFDGVGAGNSDVNITASFSGLSLLISPAYTSIFSFSNTWTLTIGGNVTLGANMSFSGSAGNFVISAASTITTNGVSFPGNLSFGGVNTKTLAGDTNITVLGNLITSGVTVMNKTSTEQLLCYGLSSNSSISGTATIVRKGGTWSGAGVVSCPLSFDGSSIIFGTVNVANTTLTGISGLTVGSSSQVNMNGSMVINTGSFVMFQLVSFVTIPTCSITGDFNVETLTINTTSGTTFSGTGTVKVGTVNFLHASTNTITLSQTGAWIISVALNAFRTPFASPLNIVSSNAVLRAIFTLNPSATCNVNANFTRVDASGGRNINTFNGVVTDSIGIYSFTDVGFLGSINKTQAAGSY